MPTLQDIQETLTKEMAVLLYFSAPTCNVCHALKPKLLSAIESNFPAFTILSVDISKQPEIASNFGVFSIPTVLVFLDGKEFMRKSRNMSVELIIEEIRRPYDIMMA